MTIKRKVIVCSVLFVGAYVYGMDFWVHCQQKSFTRWTAKHLEKRKQAFQEKRMNDLSEQERLIWQIILSIELDAEFHMAAERQTQKKAEKK